MDNDGSSANSSSEEGIGLMVVFVVELAQWQSRACAEDMWANF